MGIFVNPDGSAFQAVVNSKIYVDKTSLLKYTNKVLDTPQGFICCSCPRRFGKSVTASMLTAYYSRGCDSKELFSSLEIGQDQNFEQHLNKYDVIRLDIRWCMETVGEYGKIVSYISERTISELKKLYRDILNENVSSLPEALTLIHAETGTKFIVIIDEWEALFQDGTANENDREIYIHFLQGMFRGTMASGYLQLAI